MNPFSDTIEKIDITRISHFEKILKLIQYLARTSNIQFRNKVLLNLTKKLSIVRRVLRVFNQLIILDSYLALKKKEKIKGPRFFRYIYFLFFMLFLNFDILILFYQIKVFKNKAVMKKVFSLVNWIWILENISGIIDNLITVNKTGKEEDPELVNMLINDCFRLLFDTGFSFSFMHPKAIGESVLCTNALFSTFFGFKNLK